MKNTLFTLVLFLGFHLAYGQEILSYDWEEEPERVELTEEELKEPQITIKYYQEKLYYIENDGQTAVVEIEHKIIRLNNDEGIENNNKIYLPTNNLRDLKVNKARIIYENGEIRELEEEDIKEVTDDNGNVRVLYYAIEGVTKGVDLEVIFGRHYLEPLTGDKIAVQDEYTIRDATYIIRVPEFCELKFKTYNGLPEFKESEESGNNVYTLKLEQVEPLERELYSVYESNTQSFIYKLHKNTSSGSLMYQYEDQNEGNYEYFYNSDVKEKVIKKLVEKIGLNGLSTEEKIVKIENYIKGNINIVGSASGEIKETLKESRGNGLAHIRLYAEIFEYLDIKHEFVLTSSRFENGHFDDEFESFYYFGNYLFFIEETGKYLNPLQFFGRYPYVDEGFLFNKGLFFKIIKVGEITSFVNSVKDLQPLDIESSYQNLNATIDLSDFNDISVDVEMELFGYFGNFVQGIYRYYSEEDQTETAEDYLKSMDEDSEVEDIVVENSMAEDIGVNPLIIKGNVKTEKLIELAGNNYLFKIGNVIGKQSDLYDKEERIADIEIHNLHTYKRTLVFEIPDGYTVKNLEDLNTKVEDEEKTVGFISTYKKEGNKVTVTIHEYYGQMHYDKSEYDIFRKVVNAAADFNKITLVMEAGQFDD